jgi:hypothetical protein
MRAHRRHTRLLALAGTVAVAAALAVAALPSSATPVSYVALGDSYTAAPLVLPLAPGAPLDCLRSAVNYPHLTAAALGFRLHDRSCSAATTANMTSAQYLDQPPQFNALKLTTSVVTIGIGGNDNDLFISAVAACSATDVLDVLDLGAPCQSLFGRMFVDEAQGDGPVVGKALAGIHTRSPSAKVFVVGYPDILPLHGACYPQLPLTTGDVAYLNGVELALNTMLQQQAAAHGATFVDTYTASIGHDACQAESTRWIEPLVPGTDAFPIHPNGRGEAADARAVKAAFQSAGLG